MRKVINNKLYDTNTAKKVDDYDNGLAVNDFNYFEETLYRKRTGEFFFHGKGGAATKYRKPEGNLWAGDEKILPISESEAKKWVEEHCDVETYEELFGEVNEPDDEKRFVAFNITNENNKMLEEMCNSTGQSKSEFIRYLIAQSYGDFKRSNG